MSTNDPFAGMSWEEIQKHAQDSSTVLAEKAPVDQQKENDPYAGMSFDQVVQATQQQKQQENEADPLYNMLMGNETPDNSPASPTVDNISQNIEQGQTLNQAEQTVQDQQAQQAAQKQQEARSSLSGEPSGFVSGRNQIPYMDMTSPENITKENLKKKIAEGNYDFRHKVKLFGEQVLMTLPDMVDFLKKAPETFNIMNILPDGATSFAPSDIEVDGQKIPLDSNYHEAATKFIHDTYSVLGMDPSLEKVKGGTDTFLALAAQNIAPSGLVGAARKGIDTISGVSTQLGKFMKTEMGVSLAGAGVGTAASELTQGSPADKWGAAQIGNMVGIAGSPILHLMLPGSIARSAIKKAVKAKEFFSSDNPYEMAKERVHKHLATFVPAAEVPRIEQRMELVRRVQKIAPDFKPTVGNIIGTEESRMVQRVVDTKEHAKATEQYQKTKAAVDTLTERYRTVKDPSERAVIASALKMYSEDSLEHVRFLSDRLSVLENEARSVPSSYVSGTETGTGIRTEINNLKKAYGEAVDYVYKQVDPDNTARFNARDLISKVKSISEDTSDVNLILDEKDSGYDFISKTLPTYIAEAAARVKKEAAGTNTFLESQGFQMPSNLQKVTDVPTPYLTFEELKKLRTAINSRAKRISRADPSSVAPGILGKVDDVINEIMDNQMLHGDTGVRDRYIKATEYAKAEFYPRFREGVGGKLLKQNEFTGDYKVAVDEVGPMFWKKGPKEANIEEFQNLFSKEHLNLKDLPVEIDKKHVKDIADEASSLAREHLHAYAMRTLQDELDKAPTTDPLDIFNKWKANYKGVLRSFPEIAREADDYGESLKRFQMQKIARTEKIAKINKDIVEQYSGVQESTLLDRVFNTKSTEDVQKFVEDIQRSAAKNTGQAALPPSDPYALLYPETINIDKMTPDMVRFNQALRDSVAAELVHRSYSPKLNGPSWTAFDKLLHTHGDKLSKIFDKEGMQGLRDYGQALRLLGEENKPLSKRELNQVKAVLDSFGFSPASILSRYYSHALGKVGPVYLATDALTRILTGVTSKHFDRVYAETMYDLDGLEQVLKHMGSQSSADVIAETKSMLREKGIETLKRMKQATLSALFSQHMLLKYHRTVKSFDNLDRAEKDSNVQASQEGLLNEYLLNNDQYTGQPSRISNTMYDRGYDINEPDIFSDIEKRQDTRSSTEIYNQLFFPETQVNSVDQQGNQPQTFNEKITPSTEDQVNNKKGNALEAVYNNLIQNEGASGDTTGAAQTGALGVTSGAYASVPNSQGMSDQEVAKAYLKVLDKNIPADAPYSVQYALLDTAYNLGAGMFKYHGLSTAIDKKDWMGVARNLLDTASIGGQASRGIAARRARAYNMIAKSQGGPIISNVMQAEDGTLSYLDSKDKTIFSYRPHGGRHETSSVGMLNVQPTTTVALNTQP